MVKRHPERSADWRGERCSEFSDAGAESRAFRLPCVSVSDGVNFRDRSGSTGPVEPFVPHTWACAGPAPGSQNLVLCLCPKPPGE